MEVYRDRNIPPKNQKAYEEGWQSAFGSFEQRFPNPKARAYAEKRASFERNPIGFAKAYAGYPGEDDAIPG